MWWEPEPNLGDPGKTSEVGKWCHKNSQRGMVGRSRTASKQLVQFETHLNPEHWNIGFSSLGAPGSAIFRFAEKATVTNGWKLLLKCKNGEPQRVFCQHLSPCAILGCSAPLVEPHASVMFFQRCVFSPKGRKSMHFPSKCDDVLQWICIALSLDMLS